MRKFLGILLSIVVVPLLLASLITVSVIFWVADRESVISAFTSEAFIEQISSDSAIYEMMEANMGEIEGIDPALMNLAIHTFVTPEFMEEQITVSINQVFDYFEGKVPTLTIQIDLSSIKATIAALNPNEEVLAAIPETMVVLEPIDPIGDLSHIPPFLQPFIQSGNLKDMGFVLLGISLLLWALTAWIGGQNGKERLLWLGWTVFLPGLAVLAAGVLLGSDLGDTLIQLGLRSAGIGSYQNIPISTESLVQVMESALILPLHTGLLTTGGCATAAGVGLIGWGAATRKKPESSQA